MGDAGYVRIYRTLLGHPAFRNDGEALAFAWMVMRATWRPKRVRYKALSVTLQRGQLAISVRDLATALDRPKGWVERLLLRLKAEWMVTVHDAGVTVLTICNYDSFQGDADEISAFGKRDSDRTRRGTVNGTLSETASNRASVGAKRKNEDQSLFDETASGTVAGTPREPHAGQAQDTEQRSEEVKKEELAPYGACPSDDEPALKPEHVVEEWNGLAKRLGKPIVRDLTPERRVKLKARIAGYSLDDWQEVLANVERSPFLRGDRDWQGCTFDWMTKKANFQKILEGNYER